MDVLLKFLNEDILELILKLLYLSLSTSCFVTFVKYVFGANASIYCSDVTEISEKTMLKEKERETLTKIKKVDKPRNNPRRCPYCYALLDNVDCCPYCGSVF